MDLTVVYQNNPDTELFDSFRNIYEKSFPDKDEREPYENIRFRTFSDYSAYGNFPATICCFLTAAGKTIGGLICDYYGYLDKDTDYIDTEIIYLAVDEQCRNQGAGAYLLTFGMQKILTELESTGLKVRNVYLETKDPNKVKTSVIDPEIRVKFFEKWGYRKIKMNYRQPPLSEDRNWSDNLILMVLTVPDDEKIKWNGYIRRSDVEEFLTVFYKGLEITDQSDLYKIIEELDRAQVEKPVGNKERVNCLELDIPKMRRS